MYLQPHWHDRIKALKGNLDFLVHFPLIMSNKFQPQGDCPLPQKSQNSIEKQAGTKNHCLLGLTPVFFWIYTTNVENFSYNYFSLPLCFLLEIFPFCPSLSIPFLGPHMYCLAVRSFPSLPLLRSQVYQRFLDSDIIPSPPKKTFVIWSSWTKLIVFQILLVTLGQKACWSHLNT